jgi:enoyl-CoA hydratase/carnithine racemase
MTDSDDVVIEQDGHVGTIRLNRPERLNALSPEVLATLNAAWLEFAANTDIRSIVFTGTGRGFCAGADLVARTQATDAENTMYQADRVMPLFTARHVHLYKPVITAVNGVCAGAGLHFVVDCDIAIASDQASFTDSHVNAGQISALEPIGLSRKIPLGAVTRMLTLGRNERMSAQRAYELGMVSEVVPHDRLMDRAMELADMAASVSPATVQKSLQMLWESLDLGLEEALDRGWTTIKAHYSHPDATEGPRAFAERREPNWADS